VRFTKQLANNQTRLLQAKEKSIVRNFKKEFDVKNRSTSLFLVILLCSLLCAEQVFAQSFLNLLNSDAQKSFEFQGTGKIPKKKLERRLKSVQQMLKELRAGESRRSKDLKSKKQRYLRLATQYKQPPPIKHLKKDKTILDFHDKIVQTAEKNMTALSRLQVTYETRDQLLRSLIVTFENYLQNEKDLDKNINKYYTEGKRTHRLRKDDKKFSNRIKKLQRELKVNQKKRAEIQRELADNKKTLDKVNRLLIRFSPQVIQQTPIDLPKENKKEEAKKEDPKRKRRISRAERRRLRLEALKKARELERKKREQELKRQRLEYTQKVKEVYYRLLFELYNMQQQLYRLRLKDIDTQSERLQFSIRIFSYIKELMDEEIKRLASMTKQGLWYKRPIPVNGAMFQEITDHSQNLWKEGPDNAKKVWNTTYKNVMAYGVVYGSLIVLGILILYIVILLGTRWIRRRLDAWLQRVKDESKEDEETTFLWRFLQVIIEVLIATIPYLNPLLMFSLVLWLVALPSAWNTMLLTLFVMIPLLRISWVLTFRLFASDPNERVITQMSDKIAARFRRILRVSSFFAFLYIPVLQATTLMKYPDSLLQLLSIVFYGCLLVGFVLLFLNKQAVLDMIPEDAPFAANITTYVNRFYPLISLAAIAIYVFYSYGYVNFSGYLVRGFTVTSLMLLVVFGLRQLLIRISKKLLNIKKIEEEEDDRVISEHKRGWNENLFRLIQIVSSIAFVLFAAIAFFEIWKIGKGYRTAIQLINTPLLDVKDTQITVVSLVKMVISMSVAIWLSGWLKEKFNEYLYPALQLSPSNRHASNTVIGYLTLILGLLFGLQWMGMGLGVLTVFAGVIGIGVGFGLQNIASNFISGLIITFSKPIKVNDLIEVGSFMGVVQEISARSTTIMTSDSRLVLIPNADILTTQVINWSEGAPYVWIHLTLGVAYESNTQLVKKTLLEVADAHRKVLRRPAPIVRFSNFGDSSLDFILRFAIKNPGERWDISSELRFEIDRLFQERGLEMPFPQRDINLDAEFTDSLSKAFQDVPQPQLSAPIQQSMAKQTPAPVKETPTAVKQPKEPQKTTPPKEIEKAAFHMEAPTPKAEKPSQSQSALDSLFPEVDKK
tara:strand:- start:6242 stop:9589 length:3348 start_codon:yes stop_codon:yes gene_type:complete